ncbi:hypothetical protein SETIT_9G383700v2 [Setaria italica]|uniref:Uncharacterized protein n=2 Tax=Setaria TaxID=4554 RepID=A0A368SQ55_SETIT|nr:hypothetical protein SETIT_9G383700v2 [Setaria italica]TKV95838.1 hypothetical protein SEVIR_9G388200v2 [Setaria viridis]
MFSSNHQASPASPPRYSSPPLPNLYIAAIDCQRRNRQRSVKLQPPKIRKVVTSCDGEDGL